VAHAHTRKLPQEDKVGALMLAGLEQDDWLLEEVAARGRAFTEGDVSKIYKGLAEQFVKCGPTIAHEMLEEPSDVAFVAGFWAGARFLYTLQVWREEELGRSLRSKKGR
jgi:hypothetical protein